MSLFRRFPALRFLVFGSMAIVALSTTLHAQDLRKWVPNVGDVFVYFDSGNTPTKHDIRFYDQSVWTDTVTETILDINFYYDSIHPSVIHVSKNGSRGYQEVYYQFSPTFDSLKLGHAFAVRTGDADLYVNQRGPFDLKYDFTTGTDRQIVFMGSSIPVLATQRDITLFSPNLRWFTQESGSDWWDTEYQTLYENFDRRLIAATTSSSLVSPDGSSNNSRFGVIALSVNNSLLSIDYSAASSSLLGCQLLDLLGRPVRVWSMDVAAGESEVHLNVADVPSGVYFLRVSAAGVEEMRKVVIVR